MSRAQGKILVIRGGAIGDFILTLPVFAALRGQFPQAHLEVLGYPHIAQLAVAGGLVDRVQSIEARALAGFFARAGALNPQFCEYFAGFAVVISYLYDPDEILRANFNRCSKAHFIAGPHRPDERSELHATEVFLKPLERLAIFSADPVPRLRTVAGDRAPGGSPQAAEQVRLAMHPGSGSETKNWPEDRWAELIQCLVARTEWTFLIVGGEAETDRVERLARLLPAERGAAVRSLSLVELATRLGQCDLFIGHDSGISHLAAALGLRGVALWAETNPAIWRPRSDRVTVLRCKEGLTHLELEPVFSALVDKVVHS